MNWKDILKAEKAHCGTEKTENEEKEEFEKKLVGNQKRIDANNDGQITGKDFEILRRKKGKKSIEEEIREEVEDEGGALGMKNLKDIADKKKLKETISDMKEKGKLFEHKHGDFYTHQPK